MSTLHVIKPGAYSSIQDGGRWGFQQYGISPGGSMDLLSYRLANRLVGNSGEEPALEFTILGPVIEFRGDALIAVCGADMRAGYLEANLTLPMNRPVYVQAGTVITFGSATVGCRAYMAISGFSGRAGRVLRAQDDLPLPAEVQDSDKRYMHTHWSVKPMLPLYAATANEPVMIRVTAGPELNRLDPESVDLLLGEPYLIRPESNRMGYRLAGPSLNLTESSEMVSEPVTIGTVQLPPGGNPIILMADRQTTGGYPRLLHVITADVPKLAQAAPGCTVVFKLISLDEAALIYAEQSRAMRMLERVIDLKHREGEIR